VWGSVVVTGEAEEFDEAEDEPCEGGEEGGDVGEAGGIEDGVDAIGFGAWGDDAAVDESGFGAAAGVELDWEGDDVEGHEDREADDGDGEAEDEFAEEAEDERGDHEDP
jgi:hypothetical protein